jgi:hypothetical protein
MRSLMMIAVLGVAAGFSVSAATAETTPPKQAGRSLAMVTSKSTANVKSLASVAKAPVGANSKVAMAGQKTHAQVLAHTKAHPELVNSLAKIRAAAR